MQAKQLLVLAVAAVLAIGVAIYLQSPGQRQTAIERNLFIPGLGDNINAVTQLRLKKARDETVATLKLGEQGWTLAERSDYPADAGKIRKLLLELSEARILEQKTSNPELYSKLGVEDITSKHAAGLQLEMDGLEAPVAVIIGQAAGKLEATYARVTADQQSVLISGLIEPDSETTDWLNTELVDIASTRVQHVRINRPDGDDLEASKTGRDASLEVQNIPQGRELESATAISTLGSVLAGLALEDVVPSSSLDAESTEWITTEFHTFDGLALKVRSLESDEDYYVTMEASFDEQQARAHYQPPEQEPAQAAEALDEAEESAAGERESAETAGPPAAEEIDPSTFDEAKLEAEKLQTVFEGRAFKITPYKYDNLTKPLSSLLKEEEEE